QIVLAKHKGEIFVQLIVVVQQRIDPVDLVQFDQFRVHHEHVEDSVEVAAASVHDVHHLGGRLAQQRQQIVDQTFVEVAPLHQHVGDEDAKLGPDLVHVQYFEHLLVDHVVVGVEQQVEVVDQVVLEEEPIISIVAAASAAGGGVHVLVQEPLQYVVVDL